MSYFIERKAYDNESNKDFKISASKLSVCFDMVQGRSQTSKEDEASFESREPLGGSEGIPHLPPLKISKYRGSEMLF